jgi:hypothetical protein
MVTIAVTAKAFGLFLQSLANKEIDLDSDVIKVMLVTSAYTPNQDTHRYKASITGESTGTGYTAGGATLSVSPLSYNASTNTLMFDADDVSWPSSTVSARYAVIYDSSPGSDATRPLIGYVDFGEDVSTTSGTFQITWSASGILTLTVS